MQKLIDELFDSSINHSLYMKLYPFSTENIKGYLDYFDLKDKSILTIGSSGDQVINSFYNGSRDITLLDINPFSKYYLYLKVAAIMTFSYQEFIYFFFPKIHDKDNSLRFNRILLKKLLRALKKINYDSYTFFEYIFNKYPNSKIIECLFNDDQDNDKVIKRINNYLDNSKNYNYLKKIINDLYISFINIDIFKYRDDKKYDNIFLSNIGDLVNLYYFRDLLVRLRDNNLNDFGSILVAYLWNMNYDSDEVDYEWKHIYMMPATRYLLKNFITEYHQIKGVYDILNNNNYNSDLVMIYKKGK